MYQTSQKWKENIYEDVQCAMNIYIDDVLMNPDYILEFKKGGDLFDEEFVLGSTPSQYIEMKIYKDQITTIPKKIRVEYGILINNALTVAEVDAMLVGTLNGIPVKSLSSNDSSFEMIPIGIFNVDDYTDNDDGTLTLKALDNMINFEFNYDGSTLVNEKGYATLLEVAQDICNKSGVEFGSTSFLNSDKQIAVYDNSITARKYIGHIAESAGCFAYIGRDGKLYFRNIYQDEIEMSIDLFGEYKWGEEFKISKVSYEDGARSFKFGDDTRNNLWINQDNVFIVDENQIENIYNKVKELTINSFKGNSVIDPATDIGDKIIIDGKSIVYQGEMILEGKFVAQFDSKIQIKQKEETTVKKESQTNINRQVKSEINQIEGKITQIVKEQTETGEKLSKVEQTVDGITETIKSVETKVETAQSTADTATTKADNAQTSANNAQSTANTANTKADNAQNTADTANTNAQNAQKTADENTTKITTTTTKVTEIEKNVDGITNTVSETTKRLNNDYLTAEQVNAEIEGTKEDINILKQKQASTELTIDGFQIQIDTINNEGVNKVKTSMGYTFDDEGMKINKENADTGTIVDEAGFKVVDKTGYKETNLLYAGYVKEGDSNYPDYVGQTIVATSNIVIENYLVVGSNSRFEDYTNPTLGGKGTGVFEI